MKNLQNYNFIKKFASIKVTSICKKLNINRQNVLNGRASDSKMQKVRDEIEKEIDKLYED